MLNKVILIGRLGRDPEIRYTPQGMPVVHFSLATNEVRTKNGERQEYTEWHNVVVFGRLAEVCGEYLNKGRLVYVEGSLRTRSWEDRNGNRQYTTEVVAQSVKFLSNGKQTPSKETFPEVSPETSPEISPEVPPSDEDIPF